MKFNCQTIVELLSQPWIIPTCSLILTAAIAIVTLYIAYQQYQTAKNKLRLDLLKERYPVYEAAMTLATQIGKKRAVTSEELAVFTKKTRGASFLFKNRRIQPYCDKLYEKACEVLSLADALKNQDPLPDREAKMKELDRLCNRFLKQRDGEIKRIFEHCLQIL